VDERADAHQARLDRHVHLDIRQPVVADPPGGFAQHDDLGMGRRVDRADRLVERARDDLVTDDGHGANRDLSGGEAYPRLLQRRAHEVFVRHQRFITTNRGVRGRAEGFTDRSLRVAASPRFVDWIRRAQSTPNASSTLPGRPMRLTYPELT
jgi:hypothetical protein